MASLPKLTKVLRLILFLFISLCLITYIGFIFWLPHNSSGPLVARMPHPGSLTLLVFGDSGTGDANQMAVADALENACRTESPTAMVMLGDNFYQVGVTSTDDPEWEKKLLVPYDKPCLRNLRIYPVLGNHDYKRNPGAQIEFSRKYPRWYMPHRYYEVGYGNLLQLIAFDSTYSEMCLLPSVCSTDFLRSRLAVDSSTWTVVFAHHPLVSASVRGGSHAGEVRGAFLKPFVCNQVDAWLSGHAHHLEHRVMDGCTVDLLVSGGGGASLYDVRDDDPQIKFAQSTHGFLVLRVDQQAMQYRFFSFENKLLYEETRRK